MYRSLAALAVSLVMSIFPARADEASWQRQSQMLNPTVKVIAEDSTGSGTIVSSSDKGVYIITNFHVVADAMNAAMKRKSGPTKVVIRHWYTPANQRPTLPLIFTAEVVSWDKAIDLALVKITDPDWRSDAVAAVEPENDKLQTAETAFTAGAGLGHRPFLTAGFISVTRDPGDSASATIMASAPIINGNSGGGLWVQRGDKYVLAGVTTAVALGDKRETVPHMGFSIPMPVVRTFLGKAGVKLAS